MDLDIVRGRAEGLARALQRRDRETVDDYLARRAAVTPASVTAQIPDWADQVVVRRARVDDEGIVVWATCQGKGNWVVLEQHWIQEGGQPRLASLALSTPELPRTDLPGVIELPRGGDEHETYPDDVMRAQRSDPGRPRPTHERPRPKTTGDEHEQYPGDAASSRASGTQAAPTEPG